MSFQADEFLDRLIESSPDLPANAPTSLRLYAETLLRWRERFNLVGARDSQSLWVRHIADCLAASPILQDDKHYIDVGSGAGLPGVILAIAKPKTRFSLCEVSEKKTAFLRHIVGTLHLDNVKIVNLDVLLHKGCFDGAICRAFASIDRFVAMTNHLVSEQGRWLAMTASPDIPIKHLLESVKAVKAHPLQVCSLDEPRYLIELHKSPCSNQSVSP